VVLTAKDTGTRMLVEVVYRAWCPACLWKSTLYRQERSAKHEADKHVFRCTGERDGR